MKNLFKNKVYFLVAFVLLAGIVALFNTQSISRAQTNGDVCPSGSGWVKIDGLSGLTYTYAIPSGFTVTDNCMKVGSHAPLFGTGNVVTNTTLFNSPGNLPSGQVCTAPGVPVNGCSLQSISHASFFLAAIPQDVCTNIADIQTSLPQDHYFASAGICLPKTEVCGDDSATNYDNDVTENEVVNNNVCTYPIDVCLNIPETQTSLPDGYEFQGEGNCVEIPEEEEELVCPEGQTFDGNLQICIDCDGGGTCEVIIGGDDDEEPRVTPTPTPTPTLTLTPTPGQPNVGGSDGKSDGRSDGQSNQPSVGGQVLGASTMAPTGVIGSVFSNIAFAFGVGFTTLAGVFHGKKKKN